MSEREPILNIPGVLTALIAVLCAIHAARYMLPPVSDENIIWMFGFVPKRYDSSIFEAHVIYGGTGAAIWSFVTYAMLHADWSHLGFNMLWLLPFGSALARRFGPFRFLTFLAVTAVGGALAHLATHTHEVAPMIGASAAISGAMAGAIRFAFQRGSFLGLRRGIGDEAAHVPALPLFAALRNPRVAIFLAIWFGVNIVFGLGSMTMGGQAQSIAWQAHIGGFLAGLLLFSFFDPITPREPAGEAL